MSRRTASPGFAAGVSRQAPPPGGDGLKPGAREADPIRLTLARRTVSEALGTGLLVATVVGSGIMGERLAGGNVGLALLANTAATGAALVALILTFGPLSGAHFNPIVTLAEGVSGVLPGRDVPVYIAAQVTGGLLGTVVANLMFEGPIVSLSHHGRSGPAQLLSEVVATFGLLLIIGTVAGDGRAPSRLRWRPTSPRRTGSRRRHRSRIRR